MIDFDPGDNVQIVESSRYESDRSQGYVGYRGTVERKLCIGGMMIYWVRLPALQSPVPCAHEELQKCVPATPTERAAQELRAAATAVQAADAAVGAARASRATSKRALAWEAAKSARDEASTALDAARNELYRAIGEEA